MQVVCAERSQEEAGQQGSGSTGYSGNTKAYLAASSDWSKTRSPKVWLSQNVNFNDNEFSNERDSAVTQEESEDDDASQLNVDGLKLGLDEECDVISLKSHAVQEESEANNNEIGPPNVTDSFTAMDNLIQQTATRSLGGTRRARQHVEDYATEKELENLAFHCDALISSGFQSSTGKG